VFTGSVHLTERTRATAAAHDPWSTRDLTAAKLDTLLAAAGPGKSQLKEAEATGNPHLTFVGNAAQNHAGVSGETTTELSADDLKANMLLAADAKQPPQLDTLSGRGHTLLRQVSPDGIEQTSSGDTLDAKFRPKPAPASGKTRQSAVAINNALPIGQPAADSLSSAVQQGHITMQRRVPAKPGTKAHDDIEHAVAERSVYDGDQDRMTLIGSVELTDAGSVLWANQVALDHQTGDAHAAGAVKVNYAQDTPAQPANSQAAAPSEPTHILADRADMEHATEVATFYGKPVRLWQGASQVQAPVIEMQRTQKRLIARGDTGTGWSAAQQAAQVHTVLVSAGSEGAAPPAGPAKPGDPASACANTATSKPATGKADSALPTQNVVRIASGGLVFSEVLNQADFTGGFRADTADGTIRANAGTAYLQQSGAANATPTAAAPSLSGRVQRVVAAGHVDIQQPALHATGERLVYTASDQVFLLTGDSKNPPQATDAKGTTTGAALRMHNSCNAAEGVTVEALSAVPGEPVQRARTDSRVSDEERKQKR
jgi:lipopolysaccharide export system protein LptA